MTKAILGFCLILCTLRVESSVSNTISKSSLTAMPTTADCGTPDGDTDDCTASKWPRSNCSSAVRVMRASVDFRLWSDAGFYRWWMEPPSADGPQARLPRQQPGCK